MTATYEHSYFAQQGTEDNASRQRIAADAERWRRDRLAAVWAIAAYAVDATEARDLLGALGLSVAEIREARQSGIPRLGEETAA